MLAVDALRRVLAARRGQRRLRAITGIILYAFAVAVAHFRKTRRERFSSVEAAGRYAEARSEFLGGAAVLAMLAAIPLIVAVP